MGRCYLTFGFVLLCLVSLIFSNEDNARHRWQGGSYSCQDVRAGTGHPARLLEGVCDDKPTIGEDNEGIVSTIKNLEKKKPAGKGKGKKAKKQGKAQGEITGERAAVLNKLLTTSVKKAQAADADFVKAFNHAETKRAQVKKVRQQLADTEQAIKRIELKIAKLKQRIKQGCKHQRSSKVKGIKANLERAYKQHKRKYREKDGKSWGRCHHVLKHGGRGFFIPRHPNAPKRLTYEECVEIRTRKETQYLRKKSNHEEAACILWRAEQDEGKAE